MDLYKFGTLVEGETVPFVYPNIWERRTTTGPDRLIIAPASGQIEWIRKLAAILPEPFGILYILLVPRGGNEEGRYQNSPPASRAELDKFLLRYQNFFEQDGRHHVWIASPTTGATLVYDQHNVIYAYGPLSEFIEILTQEGLTEGEVPFPSPHSHHYHPKFDPDEQSLLNDREWIHFPLVEGQDE